MKGLGVEGPVAKKGVEQEGVCILLGLSSQWASLPTSPFLSLALVLQTLRKLVRGSALQGSSDSPLEEGNP